MIDILINSIGFAICLVTLIIHQLHLNSIKKSMGDLKGCLLQEDIRISENFTKIQSDLNLLEREVKHLLDATQSLQKKEPKTFKPIKKNFQKFLTPKGKIKKQYVDSAVAHQCYEMFHSLKKI